VDARKRDKGSSFLHERIVGRSVASELGEGSRVPKFVCDEQGRLDFVGGRNVAPLWIISS
jgi:hypothetical protein